jgi:UrcA family protein
MKSRNNLRAIALLAGAALLSTSAMATIHEAGVVTKTQTVKYSTSAAITTDGARTLYRKLLVAADRVCSEAAMGDISIESHRACVAESLDKAVQAVAIPVLLEMHTRSAYAARR